MSQQAEPALRRTAVRAPAAARSARRPWFAGLVALLGALGLAGTYAVFVGTQRGRRVDTAWMETAMHDVSYRGAAPWYAHVLPPALTVALTVAVLAVTLLRPNRRRVVVAATAAAALLGSAVLLKVALPRPEGGGLNLANSYPSGHVAATATLVVVLLLCVPRRARPVVLVVGAGLVLMAGAAVIGRQWHRPSDVVGSVCLAATWWGLARWFLAGRAVRQDRPDASPGWTNPVS